jgi:hypothetical protein
MRCPAIYERADSQVVGARRGGIIRLMCGATVSPASLPVNLTSASFSLHAPGPP